MPHLRAVALVMLGGAFGSLARYGLGLWISRKVIAESWPAATFLANILGCLSIGCLAAWLDGRGSESDQWIRAFCMVGLFGGLTTFSSFELELFTFLRAGRVDKFLAYGLGSLVIGFCALGLGWYATKALL